MNQTLLNSYCDAIDSNFTYSNLSVQQLSRQKIQGGYVEFSLSEETYVHFFTSTQELNFLQEFFLKGKPLKGLRQYIKQYYAPRLLDKQNLEENQIIIWNYEFDLMPVS